MFLFFENDGDFSLKLCAKNNRFMCMMCLKVVIILFFRFVCTKFTLTEVLEREKPPLAEVQYAWGSKSLNTCYETIFKLYQGFVGAPHFSAICRLLGYRGIFIVISELMKVTQSVVSLLVYNKYMRKLV